MEVILKKRKCLLWFPIRFTTYTLVKDWNDYALVVKKGLFSRKDEKCKIFRIEDISLERSAKDFFFGVGNVKLYTTDQSSQKSNGVINIEKIHGYRKFGNKIDELVSRERDRMNVMYHESLLKA